MQAPITIDMLANELRHLAKTRVFKPDTFGRSREAMARAADWLQAEAMKHVGECTVDPYRKDVCEGMYLEKCGHVHELHEALRAVYSITGENKQVEMICAKAVRETGGDW